MRRGEVNCGEDGVRNFVPVPADRLHLLAKSATIQSVTQGEPNGRRCVPVTAFCDETLRLHHFVRKDDDRTDRSRCTALAMLVGLIALGTAAPVTAQTGNPEDARLRLGPLGLSPTVRLTNFGWDDNVLQMPEAGGPTSNVTATLTPALQAALQLPKVRFRGQGAVEVLYFSELESFRSVNGDTAADIELMLGRLRPHAGGSWESTRTRRNFEVNAPIRPLESSFNAGVDLVLSGKTSIGVTMRRSRVEFRGNSAFLEDRFVNFLGATAIAEGARVRYAATPFTTVGAEVERTRSRFANTPERDSEGVRITSVVEFQPLAQINGSARVGVTRRTFVDGSFPPFRGTVARVDLGYTLLGRTRFGVGVHRDLSNSYRDDQRDYLQTGFEVSVTERLTERWDIRGALGRFSLAYLTGSGPGRPTTGGVSTTERVQQYGVDLGRLLGDDVRVGFQVMRQTRRSNTDPTRDFERLLVTSSVSYGF